MAITRTVKKSKGGVQDLLLGKGTVTQDRAGGAYVIDKLDLPVAVDSVEEMQALDTEDFTRARVYSDDITFQDYIYQGGEWRLAIVPLKGLTEAEHSVYIGKATELTVDTTNKELYLHDGVTPGGKRVVPIGTGSDELPLNSDFGSAAREDIGTAFDQVSLNSGTVYPVASVQNLVGLIGVQGGQQVAMKGWHPSSDTGGGTLYWDSTKPRTSHDGGSVFSPTVPFSVVTSDYLAGVGETNGGDLGCWVRQSSTESKSPNAYGFTIVAPDVASLEGALSNATVATLPENSDLRSEKGTVLSVPATLSTLRIPPSAKLPQDYVTEKGVYDIPKTASLSNAIENLYTPDDDYSWIQFESASRFQVAIPTNDKSNKVTWRYDNADSNFDGPNTFTRPYLQTIVNYSLYSVLENFNFADFTTVGTWFAAGSYKYAEVTNDKVSLTTTASKIRMSFFSRPNAGIADIFIDGQPANLVPQVDLYAASDTVTDVFVADNLALGDHLIEIVVTGTKNASSSDVRVYVSDVWGIRTFSSITDETDQAILDPATVTTDIIAPYRTYNSATTYAMAFRPDAVPSGATDFYGSIHGYEERTSLEIQADGKIISYVTGEFHKARTLQIKQKTLLKHPDTALDMAEIVLVESFTKNGYSQSYSITWLQDVYFRNGYTQMWTSFGGLAGGIPGDVNGWNDRVLLSTGYDVSTLAGGAGIAAEGKSFADEVLFYGTSYDAGTYPLRNVNSGSMGMLVTMPNYQQSMLNFEYGNAAIDQTWIQQRSTFNKMYVQPLNGAGLVEAGKVFKGNMRVKPIFAATNMVSDTFKP